MFSNKFTHWDGPDHRRIYGLGTHCSSMSKKTLLWFLSKIWRRNKHQERNISGQLKQKHRRQVQIKTQPAENFVVWYRPRSSQTTLFSDTCTTLVIVSLYQCSSGLLRSCCESCFADSSSIFTFQVPFSQLQISSIFANISRFPDDHHSIMSWSVKGWWDWMEAGGELNIERESSSGQNNFSSRSDLNPQFPMTKADDND